MIELVLLACLAFDEDRCRQYSMLFTDVSVLTCMMQGQAQVAIWSEGHPNWEVRRWSCRPHDTSRLKV